MKWILLNLAAMYIVACADYTGHEDTHTMGQRIIRIILWPFTLHSLFVFQDRKLYRLLNILWTCLIFGWFLSLLFDKLL